MIEIIDPGDTSTTISIPIFNDNLLESTELFNVFIEVGANDSNYVTVTPPGLSQVSIFNDDCKSCLLIYVIAHEVDNALSNKCAI